MLFRCDLCLYVNELKFMLTKVAISTLSLFFYLFNHRHDNYHLLLIS